MQLMGIVNATPDSFSDGGRMGEAAIAHALQLHAEGADSLDIGGESTRPGAQAVSVAEEFSRVIPVIQGIVAVSKAIKISIDTRRAAVAEAALAAGACMVNDVSGGRDPELLALVADKKVPIVLMHMRGEPATMMQYASYHDVLKDVWSELLASKAAAMRAGIAEAQIYLDPGIGFAKTTEQNLALLRHLQDYTQDHAIVLGASRKRFIGELTGQTVAADRLEGSLAVALWAFQAGVSILRIHDVAATRRSLDVFASIKGGPWR